MGRTVPTAAAVLVAATTAVAQVPGSYVEERLPNGLLVSVLADPTHPVVATQIWIRTGSAQEVPGSGGLAHLIEHLMFGGTAANPRGTYERLVHRFGGAENAYTSPDETVYHSEIPPEGHLELLALEADRMRGLVVTEENLENEKKIVLEELRLRTENDPVSRALVAAQRRLLGTHPYAWDALGEKRDIEAASLDAARSFHAAHYRSDRAHLVIVGPVAPDRVLEVVRARFGDWTPGAAPEAPVPALTEWTFPRDVLVREDIPPVEVAVVGGPLPPADAADASAVEVMIEMLSGGPFDRFREELVVRRGRALEGGTQVVRLRRGGVIAFWAASLPYRRRATAFRHAEEALASLGSCDWLTDESLAAAQRALRRKHLGRRWYAERRAGAIGAAAWWEGDPSRAFDEEERIAAVTRADVEAAFRRYVAGRPPVRLYLKPERVPWLVRALGWIVPLVDGR